MTLTSIVMTKGLKLPVHLENRPHWTYHATAKEFCTPASFVRQPTAQEICSCIQEQHLTQSFSLTLLHGEARLTSDGIDIAFE